MTIPGLGGLQPAPMNAPPSGVVTVPGAQPGVSQAVVLANRVIVYGAGGGVFVYSGTPGPGNLPVETLSDDSTDPYGNIILPGSVSYAPSSSPPTALQENGAISASWFWNGSSWQQIFYTAIGDAGIPADTIYGMGNTYGNSGWQIGNGQFTVTPGALVSEQGTPANPTVVTTDSWHAMTLLNGWAGNSGNVACQYRLTTDRQAEVIGQLVATSATAAVFFTLPSGYQPLSTQAFPCGAGSGVTSGAAPYIVCDTAGNLGVNEVARGAANIVVFHGWVSLDA